MSTKIYYALYEYYPTSLGEQKRLIVIREDLSDIEIIQEALEHSNINFENYQIEEIKK